MDEATREQWSKIGDELAGEAWFILYLLMCIRTLSKLPFLN